MRVGFGYDVHRFAEDRRLMLGGVEIPFEKGLMGHSDADVLLHAIMDALLGASGLGDIGHCFPDDDERYKDIDSMILLRQVNDLLKKAGLLCNNLDCTLVAEKPKIAPFNEKMRQNISEALAISKENVNIKATTTEGLGFAGRKEGIAAYAICSLRSVCL